MRSKISHVSSPSIGRFVGNRNARKRVKKSETETETEEGGGGGGGGGGGEDARCRFPTRKHRFLSRYSGTVYTWLILSVTIANDGSARGHVSATAPSSASSAAFTHRTPVFLSPSNAPTTRALRHHLCTHQPPGVRTNNAGGKRDGARRTRADRSRPARTRNRAESSDNDLAYIHGGKRSDGGGLCQG